MEIIVLYLRGNDEDLQELASCSMRTDAYEIYTMQSASHSCCQHIAVKTEETECISRSGVWGRRPKQQASLGGPTVDLICRVRISHVVNKSRLDCNIKWIDSKRMSLASEKV